MTGKDTQQHAAFEAVLGHTFTDKNILIQALTHRSYVNENRETSVGHNERLEFLGDAVLELIVTRALYDRFPDNPEGDLTAYRSALVNSDTLAAVAVELKISDYLRLSRGEAKDTGRGRTYILANATEAIIGAVYLDGGYEKAQALIAAVILPKLDLIIANKSWIDAKSMFQAKAQELSGSTPSYRTIRESGPDHDKQFTVGVYIAETLVAQGEGKSKQDAEQAAARKGIEVKGW